MFLSARILLCFTLVLFGVRACSSQEFLKGREIAILLTGDFYDLGYNKLIVNGVRATEKRLSLSGILIVKDISTEEKALDEMEQLISRGYKLVISASAAHGTVTYKLAEKYPDVVFVHSNFGVGPVMPNLYQFTWSLLDSYYAVGAFVGAISQSKVVGYIQPITASVGTANAFFMGVKAIDPDAVVWMVETSNYSDPDVERGAVKVLLDELKVDFLAAQQDGFTVQEEMISRGLLGVGTSGYPLDEIYGQNIGASIVRDFTQHFVALIEGVNNVTFGGTSTKRIRGTFSGRSIRFENPSFLVSPNQWDLVTAVMQPLYQSRIPYHCGPLISQFGPTDAAGCLLPNSTGKFSTEIIKHVNTWGVYKVPVTTVKDYIMSERITVLVLAAFGLFATIFSAVIVLLFREYESIKLASFKLLVVILAGVIFVLIGTIFWVIDATPVVCGLRVWLPCLGSILALPVMIAKSVRVLHAFLKEKFWVDHGKKKSKDVSDVNLGITTMVIVGVEIILLILFVSVGKVTSIYIQGDANLGLAKYERMAVCHFDETATSILYSIYAYMFTILAVGIIVTILLREAILEAMDEKRIMGNVLYVIGLCVVLVGVLSRSSDYLQNVTVFSFGFIASSYAMLGIMFIPKFVTIYRYGKNGKDDILSAHKSTRSTAPNSIKMNSFERGSSGSGSSLDRSSGPSPSLKEKFVKSNTTIEISEENNSKKNSHVQIERI